MSGFITIGSAGIVPDAPAGAAAGDLGGTYPNPTVVKLTGSAGSVTSAAPITITSGSDLNTGAGLYVKRGAVGSVLIGPRDVSFKGGIWFDTAATTPTTSNFSMMGNGNDTYIGAAGTIYGLVNGLGAFQLASTLFSVSSAGTTIFSYTLGAAAAQTIYSGATSFILKQADVATNSATGAITTIQAQNATGTTSIGGNLVLQSGTGTTHAGTISLNYGATAVFTANSSNVNIATPTGLGISVNSNSANMLINITGGNGLYIAATTQVFRDASAADWLTFTGLSTGASTATIATGVTSFTLSQALHATVAHPMTIQAGNVTTGTGSDLILQSGTGSVANGFIKHGGAVIGNAVAQGAVDQMFIKAMSGSTYALANTEYIAKHIKVTGTGTNIIQLPATTDAFSYSKYIWNAGTGTLAVQDSNAVAAAATLAAGTGAWFWFGTSAVKMLQAAFSVA